MFFLSIIALPFVASAQEFNFSFQNISTDEGLTEGYNFFILKDSKGIVWISSIDGLFEYDGYELKKHIHDPSVDNSISDNNIQGDFFEDSKANIWFTTDEGVCRYNRETDDFISFQIEDEEGCLLKNDYHLFHLEGDNKLWLRVGGFIYLYDYNESTSREISTTEGAFFDVKLDKAGNVKTIYVCPVMASNGFNVINLDSDTLLSSERIWGDKSNLEVWNALVQNDSVTWFFSNEGLIEYKNKSPNLIPLAEGIEKSFFNGAMLDSIHLILAGTSGICVFDTKNRKFDKQISCKNNVKGWIKDNVFKVYKDNEEQVWLSFNKEARISNGWIYNNPFCIAKDTLNKPIEENIISIEGDENGNIWHLTGQREVSVVNKKGLEIRKARSVQSLDSLPLEHLSSSPTGEMFALNNERILAYSETDDDWDIIYETKKQNLLFFKAISKDKILALSNKGFSYINKKNNTWFEKKISNIETNAMENGDFFLPQTDLLLLPRYDNTLNVYALKEDSIQLVQELSYNFILYATCPSQVKNQYWLGTNQGIYCFKKKGDRYEIEKIKGEYSVTRILKNILEDEEGNLWFSSSDGLYRHDIHTGKETRYGLNDGLPSNFFSFHCCHKDKDKQLWFGTGKGSVFFNPEEIKPFPFIPKAKIKAVEVNNIPYTKPITKENPLRLSHKENNLSFDIRAVGTYLPQNNQIQFRLKGSEEKWSTIKNGEKIRFNKLSSGTYDLEYSVQNGNLVQAKIQNIVFHINAPYWKTWWFYILCALALFSITALATRIYYLREIRVKNIQIEKQQALQEERNRIAGELHDDLGAGLSIIKFLSEDLNQQTQNRANKKNISKIYESSIGLLEKMGEIIWAMNTSNDTLEDLLIHIYQYSYEYLDIHKIECDIDTLADTPFVELSGEKRRSIFLVIKEILHNIVKHAGTSKVNIKIAIKDNKLCIQIQDNGIGFDESTIVKKGNGLKNMRKRISSIDGEIKSIPLEGMTTSIQIPIELTKVI